MSSFAAVAPSEFLGATTGKVGNLPVGILAVRMNPAVNLMPLNLAFSRPALERMIEDIQFILNKSQMLSHGEHNQFALADLEQQTFLTVEPERPVQK